MGITILYIATILFVHDEHRLFEVKLNEVYNDDLHN